MKQLFYFLIISTALFTGCIGDDIILDTIEEKVRITNPIDSLKIGDTFDFEAKSFNNIGEQENGFVLWISSDTAILSVDNDGLANGLALGEATLSASVDIEGSKSVSDQISITVNSQTTSASFTERTGELKSTSSYTLQGSFVLRKEGDGLVLDLESDYLASSSLPGLYVYMTNNVTSVNGALEIGKVPVFSGAHSYEIPSGVDLNTYNYLFYYCKPFGVKVGDGEFEN